MINKLLGGLFAVFLFAGSTPAQTITLTPTSATLKVGETLQIQSAPSTVTPYITWTSSNTVVATVYKGLVTAKAVGTVNILAKYRWSKATTVITVVPVTPPPPPTLTITCHAPITVASPDGFPVVVNFSPAATTTGGLQPVVIDPNPPSGSQFPVGTSTVNVTATSQDGQVKTCSFGVTVTYTAPPPTPSGFAAVIAGIRPRGYGAVPYVLKTPTTGRVNYFVAPTGLDTNNGSSTAPWKTINKAAQTAIAGDVVTIRDGVYTGSVIVNKAGTATAPIVFQAEHRGAVVLTGAAADGSTGYRFSTADMFTGNRLSPYVTVRGLIFRDYAPKVAAAQGTTPTSAIYPGAIHASTGWVIEDCWFDHPGHTGAILWGKGIVVLRSTFNDADWYAMSGWGPTGGATSPDDPAFIGIQINVIDNIWRHNNTAQVVVDPALSGAVHKFLACKNCLIDNNEVADNLGHGLWFDGSNAYYTIKNNYFHGNTETGTHLEISWGGLVENNVYASNGVVKGKAGLQIANTSGVEVKNNLFYFNGTQIELVDWERITGTISWRMHDVNIHHNFFKGAQRVQTGIAMGNINATINFYAGTTPATQNVTADYNTYDRNPLPVISGTLLRPVLGRWRNTVADTIPNMLSLFGWEAHGVVAPIAWPPQ